MHTISYRGITCQARKTNDDLVGDLPCTGLSLWDAGRVLVDFIFANPSLFVNRSVLELGSGLGFTALCVASVGATVIATDGDDSALELLRTNLSHLSNAISVRKLWWGVDPPPKCDIVIGADLIYHPPSLRPLMETISAALSSNGVAYISQSYAKFDWKAIVREASAVGLRMEGLLGCRSIFDDDIPDEVEAKVGEGLKRPAVDLWAKGVLQFRKA